MGKKLALLLVGHFKFLPDLTAELFTAGLLCVEVIESRLSSNDLAVLRDFQSLRK